MSTASAANVGKRDLDVALWRVVVASVLCLATGMVGGVAFAHGGGLDRHGCHTNRRTGEYHCHRGTAPSTPALQTWAPPPSLPAPARIAPSSRPHEGGRLRVFRNCAEARAAGAAPVRRGEPGYGPHLDRDGDGIGCEPWRRR